MAAAGDSGTVPVATLVRRLARLSDGEDWLGAVVARGDAAVPWLEALLRSAPDVVFQHRLRAATALEMIGTGNAAAALERALRDGAARVLIPVHELAEAAVTSHIARSLARTAGRAAAPVLRSVLERRCDPGCAEALGVLGEAGAVPRLVECLEDGYAQEPCLRALARFGAGAGEELARYVTAAAPADGALRIGAGAAALRLLFDLDPTLAMPLARRLRCAAPELRLAAALGLARRGAPGFTAVVLADALGRIDAGREAEVADALVACGARSAVALRCVLAGRPEPALLRRAPAVLVRLPGPGARRLLETLSQASRPDVALAARRVLAARPVADSEHR